jgi:uncharacterized protein YegP (UPF0339 family)
MTYVFEIYKDRKGEFRVRFKASNGETMFSTEGYTSKASAKGAIRSLLKNGPKAAVADLSAPAKKAPAPTRKPAAKRAAPRKAKKPAMAKSAPAMPEPAPESPPAAPTA